MKNIYIGEMFGGRFLYSEYDLFDPSRRISFNNKEELFNYLSGNELKKIRKRRNILIYSSLKNNEELVEKLSEAGFRSTKIEKI